jgi:hypothetical protein
MRAKLARRIGTSILIALGLSPFLYVGSYYALVDSLAICVSGIGPWQIPPTYRVGGDTAKSLFAPIHEFDRKIRPDHWQFDF